MADLHSKWDCRSLNAKGGGCVPARTSRIVPVRVPSASAGEAARLKAGQSHADAKIMHEMLVPPAGNRRLDNDQISVNPNVFRWGATH